MVQRSVGVYSWLLSSHGELFLPSSGRCSSSEVNEVLNGLNFATVTNNTILNPNTGQTVSGPSHQLKSFCLNHLRHFWNFLSFKDPV